LRPLQGRLKTPFLIPEALNVPESSFLGSTKRTTRAAFSLWRPSEDAAQVAKKRWTIDCLSQGGKVMFNGQRRQPQIPASLLGLS